MSIHDLTSGRSSAQQRSNALGQVANTRSTTHRKEVTHNVTAQNTNRRSATDGFNKYDQTTNEREQAEHRAKTTARQHRAKQRDRQLGHNTKTPWFARQIKTGAKDTKMTSHANERECSYGQRAHETKQHINVANDDSRNPAQEDREEQ